MGHDIEEQIRSLLTEGRIWEAHRIFESAGDLIPAGSKLRKVLAPPIIRRIDKRDVDRSPEFAWLRNHGHEYQGKWVAVSGDNLAASSDTLEELLRQLDQLQLERSPLIHHLI